MLSPQLVVLALCASLFASPGVRADESQPAPVAQPAPPLMTYSYYCDAKKAYYPTVTHCEGGWIAIPAGQAPAYQSPPYQSPPYQSPGAPPAVLVPARPYVLVRHEPEDTGPLPRSAISIELLGRALNYSLDYDYLASDHLAFGIGIVGWTVTHRSDSYSAFVTVVPIYANYYLSEGEGRGYLTVGLDVINASANEGNHDIFTNRGVAAVVGGGYELREHTGLLLRLGIDLIGGSDTILNPSAAIGFSF